jgi:hypothetical protein
MRLAVVSDSWRFQGELPATDKSAVDGDGKVEAGFPHVAVVEEVSRACPEVGGVEELSAVRNLHAELMFFIALAVQRHEGGVLRVGEVESQCPNRRSGEPSRFRHQCRPICPANDGCTCISQRIPFAAPFRRRKGPRIMALCCRVFSLGVPGATIPSGYRCIRRHSRTSIED